MKKIYLISAGVLPVPNVSGGAIETILTNIINQNEIDGLLDLTIVSVYNKEAYSLSKQYKNTKFVFIKKKTISYILCYILNKIKGKILKIQISTYLNKVLSKIKNKGIDYLIVEGGQYEAYKHYLKYFDRSQMVLHLHHHFFANETLNEIFGSVITVSDFVGKEWAKNSKNQNIITLKNGIDIKKFDIELIDSDAKELKKRYNIKDNDFVVGYCGRIIEIKGVLELVKSVKKIDKSNLKLLLIGSSDFNDNTKTEYLTKIENEILEIKDRVIFTGYVNNSEIYKYYKLTDVIVIPSIVEDAATLTSVEASACGKPIIATRSGGIPEYVTNRNAIIVEKNQNLVDNLSKSILMLMDNDSRLQTMGRESFKNSKQYSLKKYYNNFVKVISEL